MNASNQNQGYVVVLSLMILSVVLVIALILGNIIIREVKLSAVIDKSALAFYAAESAAEQALYEIQQGTNVELLSGVGSLSNGVTWSREVFKQADTFNFDYLNEGQSVYVDIFKRLNVNDAAGVNNVNITWQGASSLDLGVRAWDGLSLSEEIVYNCPGSCPVINWDPNLAYSLRIYAPLGSLVDLVVGTNGVLVDTATTVQATGSYQGTSQAVQLLLPLSPPWQAS